MIGDDDSNIWKRGGRGCWEWKTKEKWKDWRIGEKANENEVKEEGERINWEGRSNNCFIFLMLDNKYIYKVRVRKGEGGRSCEINICEAGITQKDWRFLGKEEHWGMEQTKTIT